MFSETVKSLRIRKDSPCGIFVSRWVDASNWSKVERGINPPPSDVKVLERLAGFFGLAALSSWHCWMRPRCNGGKSRRMWRTTSFFSGRCLPFSAPRVVTS